MKLIGRVFSGLRRSVQPAGASRTRKPVADGLVPKGAWSPTHRHRKGGLYRVLARGILETDRSAAVIYDDAEGTIWIRPAGEFDDGRFESL